MSIHEGNESHPPTLAEYEQACKDMYAEMWRWAEQGYSLLLMERDGENLKLRPVA